MNAMKTEDAQRCMRLLMDAEKLLGNGRIEDARVIVASVRTELVSVDALSAHYQAAKLQKEGAAA